MEIIYTDKDGTTVKFTEEMAIAAITERDGLRTQLSASQDRASERYGKIVDIRDKVRKFFEERYDNPSDQTDITCTVDDINDLLKEIGTDILKSSYCVEGTITFSISNILADNEDEASDLAYNNVRLEYDDEGELGDDWSVEITSISRD
jgi:hypothetical protein